jgi:hypothetical protein
LLQTLDETALRHVPKTSKCSSPAALAKYAESKHVFSMPASKHLGQNKLPLALRAWEEISSANGCAGG